MPLGEPAPGVLFNEPLRGGAEPQHFIAKGMRSFYYRGPSVRFFDATVSTFSGIIYRLIRRTAGLADERCEKISFHE
jgi:hypothetical protein